VHSRHTGGPSECGSRHCPDSALPVGEILRSRPDTGPASTTIPPVEESVPEEPGPRAAVKKPPGGETSLVDLLLHLCQTQQQLRELLLILSFRYSCLLIFQLVDRLFELFLLIEQGSLGRVARRRRVRAEPHHRKVRRKAPFAVLGRRRVLAFALAGIFEDRMLGRKALLGFEKLRGLL